ncbi:MAG TPA: hypothetical protein VGI66_06760 [Streptosporangiaceae bacterium]
MATAVQTVYSSHRGSLDIVHIGSVHDDVEVALLKSVARPAVTGRAERRLSPCVVMCDKRDLGCTRRA